MELRLNTRADKALLDAMGPQVVFVAEGSEPRKLALPGADGANVTDALAVLSGKVVPGEKTVIIGGGLVACELALHLAQSGRAVTLLARRALLRSSKLPPMNDFMLRDLLVFNKVDIIEGAAPEAVNETGVIYRLNDQPALAEADTVIAAVGMERRHSLFDQIRNDYENVLAIGDGRKVRNIQGAIWDSYEAARYM